MGARDKSWLEAAGIVLVRQRPGSAKGVISITLEDETGIANLIVWPKVFEKHRRIVLGAGMFAVKGKIQPEGEVVHLVAHSLTDLSAELPASATGTWPSRCPTAAATIFITAAQHPIRGIWLKGLRPRDIYIPDLHTRSRLRRGISGDPYPLPRVI
jgi:error-prone DNA polymerase